MPKLNTTIEITDEEALAHLRQVYERGLTRFGEGDAVRLNRRATPQPPYVATNDRTGEPGLEPGLHAALRRGTVGLIKDYAGAGVWQGRGHEQDIYEVLLLGADGKTYCVTLPDRALTPYAPRFDAEAHQAAALASFAASIAADPKMILTEATPPLQTGVYHPAKPRKTAAG